jgi:hypothetical protein
MVEGTFAPSGFRPGSGTWLPGRERGRRSGLFPALVRSALLSALALLARPDGAHAQWVLAPGEGWVDATFVHHDTDDQFDRLGIRREMFGHSRALTRSLIVTGAVGVVRGIDVWLELPFHNLRFEDGGGRRVSRGAGDPRTFVRVGGELVGLPGWPVALRGGVKLDLGDFDVDSEIVPLSEGQRDWEFLLELGHSFYPRPFWTMGWIGHRWRGENTEVFKKPGNEIFWFWTLGGTVGPVGWKASVDGFTGGSWHVFSLRLPAFRRALHQLLLSADYGAGPGRITGGVRIPVRGRNLPAGSAFTAGYFYRWGRG